MILTKPDIIKQDIVFKAGSRLALNRNPKVLFYSFFYFSESDSGTFSSHGIGKFLSNNKAT